MRFFPRYCCAVLGTLFVLSTLGLSQSIEKIRNNKVVVYQDNLQPKETVPGSSGNPALILSLEKGRLQIMPGKGIATTVTTEPGGLNFESTGIGLVSNRGSSPLEIVRVEFHGAGSLNRLGRVGLSKHYKLLLENQLVRVYDIYIPARSSEPRHTHKDRVVVCLSGAELTHLFPNGRTEVSTLKTGEVVWRKGSTHVGQNRSSHDFHAIAIEPK